MNQQTAIECNEIASVKEFKNEYQYAIDRMNSALGRKEIVYWCHRVSELRQVMENSGTTHKSLYQGSYSGIG